jgi:hypothetical protein
LISLRGCWFRRQLADMMLFARAIKTKAEKKKKKNGASPANGKSHATRIVTAKVQGAQQKACDRPLRRGASLLQSHGDRAE